LLDVQPGKLLDHALVMGRSVVHHMTHRHGRVRRSKELGANFFNP
jgi:hypothetical protein